jgi:hypothetical protein
MTSLYFIKIYILALLASFREIEQKESRALNCMLLLGSDKTSQQVQGSKFLQAIFSQKVADLMKSLDYTAGEDPVPEQSSMRAIGSPGQVLLT